MQHPKPRVEFSEAFKAFAGQLIDQCSKSDNPKLRITRRALNALAGDHGFRVLTTPNQRALREFMTERGYKIQIGAVSVFLSRLPVTNVAQDQWPALIENICQKLDQLYREGNEKQLRLTPAKFRNVATIWPNDNAAFNQACVDEMHELGYTMVFRVNYIDVFKIGDEPRPGKRVVETPPEVPRLEVLNGRALLDIALHPRRVAWRRGFTHALTVDAMTPGNFGSQALSHALLHLPGAWKYRKEDVPTHIALNLGDVLLVNETGYELIKSCNVHCIDSSSVYPPAITATPLHKENVNNV